MFETLTQNRREQMIEVCRYFFRCNVMRTHLHELLERHENLAAIMDEEWDEFWAYYCFWLSGLWVTCEGIERIGVAEGEFLATVKRALSQLHPVRQATFHYKPDTSQMMRHFATDVADLTEVEGVHADVSEFVGAFLASLPNDFINALGT